MANDSISTQISLSRNDIMTQISDYMKSYLELENVDLTKSSFLSFLINTISTLTGNLLFYQLSSYREFFLTKAQLPESILNLSAFLGYTSQNAGYATALPLITMPFGFPDASTNFTIPEGFKVNAGTVEFLTYYDLVIKVTNNTSVTATATEGSKVYSFPVNIDIPNNQFSFILPVKQIVTSIQEFQIDEDLQIYQFCSIEVPISGKVTSLKVEIREPESVSWDLYTLFNSLYLMNQTDKGYVSRRTDSGKKLYFGNGLIGAQPTPGSTVKVTADISLGADGNVIAGTISNGDRIYNITGSGVTQIVNYDITNTSPATGGTDEESTEEIRSNSIANLTALGRLVSESDFENADVVMVNSPIAPNSLPVLKRSDVKTNEIELFTTIEYGGLIIPTRNTYTSVDKDTLYIPRQTTLSVEDVDFYTLFDMTINRMNGVAYYHYIMYEIEQTPTLITNYGLIYNIVATNLTVSKSGQTATFKLDYTSTESDAASTECIMTNAETELTYIMTNDSTGSYTYTFSDYLDIPDNEQTFYFTISNGANLVANYSNTFIFRKSLNDFMMSNAVCDSTSNIVYDIPVIKSSYYNGLEGVTVNKRDFEMQILQQMMTSMEFKDYKMLTDFVNVKFANTTGSMTNMQYNEITKSSVIDISSIPPTNPTLGSRYIVLNGTGSWYDHENEIAQCSDSTAVSWVFYTPHTDDTIYVTNKLKKYIFAEGKWIIPEYNIPFEIEIEVIKSSTYVYSNSDLSTSIRTALISAFQSRFGVNVKIYRSEIIDVIQEVSGVNHCRLIKPESSIFFDYDIDDFEQIDLLKYGPEYVYFDTDSITIRVIADATAT